MTDFNFSYGSVCSGIEAASVAWDPLGFRGAWLSEIEPFPCAVLDHHWPDCPNLGDLTKLPDRMRAGEIEAPDLLVGGTPCQAFSVAGNRQSLDDERGQLSLIYGELLDAIDEQRESNDQQPAIALWENVPGALSTKDNAFGWFLGLLAGEFTKEDIRNGTATPIKITEKPDCNKWSGAGCVIGKRRSIAWRILDAQFFGVAQRRRRLFVVATARKDVDPCKILFEFDSLRRDIAPSRSQGATIAGGATKSTIKDSKERELTGYRKLAFTDYRADETAACLTVRGDMNMTSIISYGLPGNWINRKPENGGNATTPPREIAPCQTTTDQHGVFYGEQVRRLTPRECERLQGFPDDYTLIPDYEITDAKGRTKKKQAADSARYKSLGNSMAVPVMQWIGERIKAAIMKATEQATNQKEAATLPTNQPNYIKGNKAHTGQEETGKDQWRTPKEIIKFWQGCGVDFTLDAAASNENAICEKYFSIADNALIQSWETSGAIWCNPPYSNISAWINKAIEESDKGAEIIMLVPNSTDTKWYKKALAYCDVCLVVGGRVGFINSDSNMTRSANTRGSMFLLFPMAGIKTEYRHILRSTLMSGDEVVA